jgi:hypothetical protein
MKPLLSLGLWALTTAVLAAQTAPAPQVRFAYEDRAGTAGHTLVLEGKSYGPYKEIVTAAYSTSGTAAAFAVLKRDKVWILAQGKEAGPLPVGFDLDRLQVADDGRVWILTATRTSADSNDPNETLLMVNGKTYGPYPELTTVEYAETGGAWVAAVRTAADEADVLVGGKAQGPFFTVDHAWITPDGKSWGYATSDSEGKMTVVTSEKTWSPVQAANFTNLYPREPHWGYSLRVGDEDEKIVVDGQSYEGYLNFQGLVLTPSGRHWAFEAEKLADTGDSKAVVIDGKEYPGEDLSWSRLGSQETFLWTVREGSKVSVQTLRLP